MSKINIWKCDICKKEFREGSYEYNWNGSVNIKIEIVSPSEMGELFNFSDTCSDCRNKLREAINELVVDK